MESPNCDISCASWIDHIRSLKLCLPFLKLILKKESRSADITRSFALLNEQEEEYQSVIDGAWFTDHILSIKSGLLFLRTFHENPFNKDLEMRVKRVLYEVSLELHSLSNRPLDGSLILDLDTAYTELREKMKNVIINPETRKYYVMQYQMWYNLFRSLSMMWRSSWWRQIDLHALLMNKFEAFKENQFKYQFILLRVLLNYVSHVETVAWVKPNMPLVAFIREAVCLLYLCLVDKMDKEMTLTMKHKISDLLENTKVKEFYMLVLRATKVSELSSGNPPDRESRGNSPDKKFYLLDNLIKLLDCNVSSEIYLNGPIERLHDKLKFLKTFIADLPHEVRLEKCNYLVTSIEAITSKAMPILYSCYEKDMEDGLAREVNGALSEVFDLIKHIEADVREVTLYNYPKTDGLGFMDLLLGHLEELLKCRQELIEDLKNEIETLHGEFDSLRPLLRKIKEQYNEHEELRNLSTRIIGLAYRAEYVVDIYLVEGFPNSRIMLSISKIIEQTKLIKSEVQRICDDEEKYQTQAHYVAKNSNRVPPQAIGATTDEVVGFEDEAKKIMDYLVEDTKKRDVLSIVGLPGLGKTTLAKKMYEDPLLIEHFDVRAWCTVSQTFQKRELLLTILGDVLGVTEEINKLDEEGLATKLSLTISADVITGTKRINDEGLARKLFQSLKGRRYLIIIDDLWGIEAWDALVRSLPDDKNCSRILITSRLQNVVSQIKARVYPLRQFSNDESWKLFKKKILREESFSKELLEVGKQISKNCKGLPLAIVVIAGLLTKVEKSVHKWKQIADNLSSHILSDSEVQCRAILELSYNHLSDHLKSCFLYFGAFAEDEEILVSKLKRLWIAEGFVQNTGVKSLEYVVEEYFMDLISRSLVTATRERTCGGVKACRVHDLLHDFCLEKSKEEGFLHVIHVNYGSEFSGAYDCRRLSIHSKSHYSEAQRSGYSVRSLLQGTNYKLFFGQDISFLVKNFKLLMVLDLGSVRIDEYFSGIELLIHLRYLAIVVYCIKTLPSSISNLWNLKYLLIQDQNCWEVTDVPESLWDMVNLRHVHINDAATFNVYAKRLENASLLGNLEALSTPCLSYGEDAENLLRGLPKLRKLRCVFKKHWDASTKCYRFPVLDFLDQLKTLKVIFRWEDSFNKNRLCEFNFPSNLEKLTLSKFEMRLDVISEIGTTLPKLKVLKLNGNSSGLKWIVNDGVFPQLKYLKLSKYANLREWIAWEDSFPILEQLVVEECEELVEIPPCFAEIPTLQMITMNNCNRSVDDSARRIQRKLKEEGQNEELKVYIYPRTLPSMKACILLAAGYPDAYHI